jgi:xanthine dehydrogenase YagS FAD-binding subunit
VGTKPWRARRAEQALIGEPATPERFGAAAAVELEAAEVRRDNSFKVELARRAVVRALTRAIDGGAR